VIFNPLKAAKAARAAPPRPPPSVGADKEALSFEGDVQSEPASADIDARPARGKKA
jgi:hypothetical protein